MTLPHLKIILEIIHNLHNTEYECLRIRDPQRAEIYKAEHEKWRSMIVREVMGEEGLKN